MREKKIVLNTDRGKGFGDWIHSIYVDQDGEHM